MKYFAPVVVVGLIALGGIYFFVSGENRIDAANSFDECVSAGNPVMESYPRQCTDKAGNHFVEEIVGIPGVSAPSYTNASEDDIVTDLPSGALITSPLTVTGMARGYWFFEASFPVLLTDWDGKIIAEGYATAESEWMTSEFVPYAFTIEFEKPAYGERGTLILKRDNPSGLPENDAAMEIPVLFE